MNRRAISWKTTGAVKAALATACLALLLSAIVSGCGAAPRKRSQAGATPITRDVDPILRGLVGSMTSLRGREPMMVSGYGIVVGLNGTGSSDMPVNVRSYMEREMALRGVGQVSRGFGEMSPSELLNDPNTAVVLVQAAIPPGAPDGTRFDVLVRALPGTSTTSLEGGRLWTTSLFRGNFVPGGPATEPLAEANGQVFINPFVDPAEASETAFSSNAGRILNGGEVIEALDLLLVLDNPSHARARSIVAAINSKFPQASEDRLAAASGRSEEVIELNVPYKYRKDTIRFIQLVLHTRVEMAFAQEYAVRYTRALREQPALAQQIMWGLQSLGAIALPQIRELYDYSELTPRLAALEAGAGLKDPLVEPHLIELAEEGPPALRTRAIEMLGELKPDPSANLALRRLLSAEEMDVRVAAYEALHQRFDPAIERTHFDGKFMMDVVPFGDPMIYINQQGQPRIVLFGANTEVERPAFVAAWDDRLMLTADDPESNLRVYYLDYRSNRSTTASVKPSVPELIEFFEHKTTPEAPAPGLNMTYSEVVGALYEVWRADAIPGVFVAEQDRLIAELLRSSQTIAAKERPETSGDDPEIYEPTMALPGQGQGPRLSDQPRSYVVPLKRASQTNANPPD